MRGQGSRPRHRLLLPLPLLSLHPCLPLLPLPSHTCHPGNSLSPSRTQPHAWGQKGYIKAKGGLPARACCQLVLMPACACCGYTNTLQRLRRLWLRLLRQTKAERGLRASIIGRASGVR